MKSAMAGLIRHVCRSRAVFRCSRLLQPTENVRPFHCSALLADLQSGIDKPVILKNKRECPEVQYVSARNCASEKQDLEKSTFGEQLGGELEEPVTVDLKGKIDVITLNRPETKNAIDSKMYEALTIALREASLSSSTLTVITGAGDHYSSGNGWYGIPPLKEFVKHLISFPKPLIAVVNGPAVGVSVTTLPLFDAVYATEKATFHTPSTELGQAPDGCSTLTFPKLMGYAKANEMLLFGKKITAREACKLGLVTEVFPDDIFQKEVWDKLNKYMLLPYESLGASKRVIMSDEMKLYSANHDECLNLHNLNGEPKPDNETENI